jgi:hypothetical protein
MDNVLVSHRSTDLEEELWTIWGFDILLRDITEEEIGILVRA